MPVSTADRTTRRRYFRYVCHQLPQDDERPNLRPEELAAIAGLFRIAQ